MKKKHLCLVPLCFLLGIPGAFSQSAPATNQLTAAQQGAHAIAVRRVKALKAALQAFQANNDQTSASLISDILASLNQPDGQSKDALAADLLRMKNEVRVLVQEGAMESASLLNMAQILSFYSPDFPAGPPVPNNKAGGTPGPGGLVLYFPFDQPDTNGVVRDESGEGNDGRVFGAQWITDGKFGGAYHFSISNLTDKIVVPNSDSLNPDYLTVSVWIKVEGNCGIWRRILDKDFSHGYCLSLAGNDNIGNAFDRGKPAFETSLGDIRFNRVLDDGQWHHLAETFDGHQFCSYVDGVPSKRQARRPGPLKKSGWDLCIGNTVVAYGWDELNAFDGAIDEVRIYNRALTADEIKTLATATGPGADLITTPAPATADATDRLKKVKALYDQGLITKDQYDQKVQEIINSL